MLAEPGRTWGTSFRRTACALQGAGLYIAGAGQAPSENAGEAQGVTALAPHLPLLPGFDSDPTFFRFAGSGSPVFIPGGEGHVAVCSLPACLCTRARACTLRVNASSSCIYPAAVSVALRSVCRETKLPPPLCKLPELQRQALLPRSLCKRVGAVAPRAPCGDIRSLPPRGQSSQFRSMPRPCSGHSATVLAHSWSGLTGRGTR